MRDLSSGAHRPAIRRGTLRPRARRRPAPARRPAPGRRRCHRPARGPPSAPSAARSAHADAVQVQHRPGHDLVVRYDAEVAWGDRRAATARRSWPPRRPRARRRAPSSSRPTRPRGRRVALPVRPPPARAGDGGDARTASTGCSRASCTGDPHLEVVAYRPIRRAVVRATAGDRAGVPEGRPPEGDGRHRRPSHRPARRRPPRARGARPSTRPTASSCWRPSRARTCATACSTHTTGWPPALEYVRLMAAARGGRPARRVGGRARPDLSPAEMRRRPRPGAGGHPPREADRLRPDRRRGLRALPDGRRPDDDDPR